MVNVILAILVTANGQSEAPERVRRQIVVVRVPFKSFTGKTETGSLEVHRRVAREVEAIFREIQQAGFPIESIRPMKEFGWDDDASMEANNTSGFCWRTIKGSTKLSDHAYGLAIDINPRLNPQLDRRGRPMTPGSYDKSTPGSIFATGPVVRAFERRGWRWGGRWKSSRDLMHFSRRIY